MSDIVASPPAQPAAPAPARKRRRRANLSLSERLLRFSVQKPAETIGALGALVATLHTLFYGLGLVALANREQLLGLGSSLEYPLQKALLTSLHVLWALPWSMLTAPHYLLPAILVPLLLRWLCRRFSHAWVFRSTYVLIAVIVLVVISLLSAAARPPLLTGKPAPYFETDIKPDWGNGTQAEVITWLTNDHPDHPAKKQALFGGVGATLLFLVLIGVHLASAARPSPDDRWPTVLLLIFLFLTLVTLPLLPKTYAIMTWGIEYPRVSAGGHSGCCTYAVSAGGTPFTTLQVGENCKEEGFKAWTPEQAHGLLIGVKEIIRATCK